MRLQTAALKRLDEATVKNLANFDHAGSSMPTRANQRAESVGVLSISVLVSLMEVYLVFLILGLKKLAGSKPL
ncbi:MAG: hypothetical protein ACREIC_16170 [Limisphaerales bacterium]